MKPEAQLATAAARVGRTRHEGGGDGRRERHIAHLRAGHGERESRPPREFVS